MVRDDALFAAMFECIRTVLELLYIDRRSIAFKLFRNRIV